MRGLFWFRSDLRLRDQRGLAALVARVDEWAPVFILDDGLLESARTGAPRVRFLLDCLARLDADLRKRGSRLVLRHGRPEQELPRLVRETGAELVVWSRDYGAFASARDARIQRRLERDGCRVETVKDRVVYESDEVRTAAGGPYAVYTPYAKTWRARFAEEPELPTGPLRLPRPIPRLRSDALPLAKDMGFVDESSELPTGGEAAARRRLDAFLDGPARAYARDRDRPAVDGTSRLSPYLRFGAISVRSCIDAAHELAHADPGAGAGVRKWVDELIWREFYYAILAEHPRVARESYRREYDALEWENDDQAYQAWCAGRTGYPIVDAGMRQLAATGWVHNRVRMIVASFLTKDLLIDWRLGEHHFYRQLVDGDPACNNGGWQWAASTGTDAQPYFRIFNPTTQGERYDPDGAYVRRWLPELRDLPADRVHKPWASPILAPAYPAPIVDHAERRRLALQRYEAVRA